MSMGIGNNYNSYASCCSADYANPAKKADSERDNADIKESHVTTSTVELKTSTPGKTRTEQIKTGYSNVNDYSKYLQDKYSYMNTGTTSMQGIPTTVSVSGAFLKKCMNDPEKAKYLEENLAAIPDCVKSLNNYTKMMPGSPVVTYTAYYIDENGNISGMSGCTNDPDGKIARENAERKAKEQKEKEEKLEKQRTERKKQEERLAERRAKRKAEHEALGSRECKAVGKDAWELTEKMVEAMENPNNTSVSETSGFDMKI